MNDDKIEIKRSLKNKIRENSMRSKSRAAAEDEKRQKQTILEQ